MQPLINALYCIVAALFVLVAILYVCLHFSRRRWIRHENEFLEQLRESMDRHCATTELYLMIATERVTELISDACAESALKPGDEARLTSLSANLSNSYAAQYNSDTPAVEWLDGYHGELSEAARAAAAILESHYLDTYSPGLGGSVGVLKSLSAAVAKHREFERGCRQRTESIFAQREEMAHGLRRRGRGLLRADKDRHKETTSTWEAR
ncbi:Uncharacterised protein [Mycobacteroides abscessus subsp. abscessus]|uniref:hypothetical protein n=1 Tax=Mycobacteroides abscessus TaxID=36809 RepID=UPI0009A5E8F1|nr:hypothetical protein [Mycobacteroides abscessus]SKO34064.1 Uncharacterised protein [Mycobacteroides abscessus subsp. abscessus]